MGRVRLNGITIPNRYLIPNMADFTHGLRGTKIFTIDLVKAYHQTPVEPADVEQAAIITPFGLFEFLFMTFRLYNAAQTVTNIEKKISTKIRDAILKKKPMFVT